MRPVAQGSGRECFSPSRVCQRGLQDYYKYAGVNMFNWLKKIFQTETQPHTEQRSGEDRRSLVDSRNPGLQNWIREFWNVYFQDNPDKNRRRIADRRR